MRVKTGFLSLTIAMLVAFRVAGQTRVSAQSAVNAPSAGPTERIQVAATALGAAYDKSTGLFRGTGWWNSANGITALASVSRDLHSHDYDSIFANTLTKAPQRFPGFLNEFYDDEGWWALAWLDVYALQKEPQYLHLAESIFQDMTGGWSDTCGGGIWWKKNEHYKNAIANELFLSVAVRLAAVSPPEAKAKYLAWAEKEEHWFLASGMINSDSLVNDGLDASCHNNHRDTWSYNQGVLLTGLVGYHQLTGDPKSLETANHIASAVVQRLADKDGVIHDPCEPNCGEDGVQFKGILMRNLVVLQQASPSADLTKLIENNADSVWTRARTDKNQFSVDWAGPPQDSGTGSLISALDALTAALSVARAPAVSANTSH